MKRPIFLSASVPSRDPFIGQSDPVSIREAVLALVVVTVRERPLVFGGHPAISPLVEHAARSLGGLNNVHIYQSRYFEKLVPDVARRFANFHWTDTGRDEPESLDVMRREMVGSWDFAGAVFVGGMEGVFDESRWFRELHGGKPQFAVGSTGGAAKQLLRNLRRDLPGDTYDLLANERRYRRLFRKLLPDE